MYNVNVTFTSSVSGITKTPVQGSRTVDTQAAALTAAVAAAQLIGAGDASAEIDAIDVAAAAYVAAVATSGVTVIVNTTDVPTIAKLRKALEAVLPAAKASGAFTD